jgi:hypothetical protein
MRTGGEDDSFMKLEANFFGTNLVAFAVAIFLTRLLSIVFRLEKTAYRYASITRSSF